MEKFKTGLLSSLSILVIILTIMLLSNRTGVSQPATTAAIKKPFQLTIALPDRAALVNADSYFVIESAEAAYNPGAMSNGLVIETVSGGNTGYHHILKSDSAVEENISDKRIIDKSVPLHICVDPKSIIALQSSIPSCNYVTLSGYLTKSLP